VAIAGLDSADPRADRAASALLVAHAALSTSGDLERGFELDGVRYSHILDPRNGQALTERRLVSVLAPSATESDAWATALSVLGPTGLALLAGKPGCAARVVVVTPRGLELFESDPPPSELSCATPAPLGADLP
jgi:thiamine biosynthesis lipoprotein